METPPLWINTYRRVVDLAAQLFGNTTTQVTLMVPVVAAVDRVEVRRATTPVLLHLAVPVSALLVIMAVLLTG
jgi:hypothetical protein